MQKLKKGSKFPNFKYNTPSQSNIDFYQQTNGKKAIISFLRYNGCPVCRMEMAEYKKHHQLLADKNTELFVVLQSTQKLMQKHDGESKFPFTIICDPKGDLFDEFGVEASVMKFLNPKGLVALTKATFKGHMHGKFEGKETQMPATFAVDENKNIRLGHYGANISDVPGVSDLLGHL